MKKEHSIQNHSISQWFLLIFTLASLIFCLTLFPLLAYLQSTFSELQMEKARQQLSTGATELEDTVTGLLNVSSILSSDPRFVVLRYNEPDYSAVPANIRNQLKNTFGGLLYPLETISDAALLFDQNVAITQNTIFFYDVTCYYPDFFCVDDLSYEEWKQLLSERNSGFLPAHRIKTHQKEYDALVYVLRWGSSAYIYACLDISTIKELLIADPDLSGYYFTITDTNGTLLYSDLSENHQNYQTLGQKISTGGLSITIHIADSVFYNKMKPLYLFFGIYCGICVVVLILVIVTGTHISSKPILNILRTLDRSVNIPAAGAMKAANSRQTTDTPLMERRPAPNLHSGFDYISNRILSADHTLGQYQNMLHTQQKMLQARFLEKAISGQLISPRDISLFHSYFPAFPDSYCLLFLRLQIDEDHAGTIYTDSMSLLQSFLGSELPHAYQQQLSTSELLLLISEADYESYRETLDFTVENINREEPSYYIRCVAGKIFKHPEDLPAAYRQVQDMIEIPFPCSRQRVCTMSDCIERPFEGQQNLPFTMTDLTTLYSAISFGNEELALEKLHMYSEALNLTRNVTVNCHMHEMLSAILTFIKLEHPLLLMDLHIPAYRINDNQISDNTLYAQLEEPVRSFCRLIRENLQDESDSLVKDLISYIDQHYTDCDLCFTTLETQFHCSSSTIRKVFKNATNVTVSHYIEQKRMNLASELLSQKDKTIAEVADECGYTNPNSFYKAYKRVYGCAPTQVTK